MIIKIDGREIEIPDNCTVEIDRAGVVKVAPAWPITGPVRSPADKLPQTTEIRWVANGATDAPWWANAMC